MDSKIRKRKFNKMIAKENQSHQSFLLNLPISLPQCLLTVRASTITTRAVTGLLFVLSAVLIHKLYHTFVVADGTFVPFGGNATFPHPPLLGGHFWGSLLSGHYFGLRAAVPNSPIVSLMWFRNQLEPNGGLSIRHWANHDDRLARFFWNYNDVHSFGHQSIVDRNLRINTSFIKLGDGRAIEARITVRDTDTSEQSSALNSIILYSATETNRDTIEGVELGKFADNQVFTIKTVSGAAGNYSVNFRVRQGTPVARSYLNANSTLDQLKETVLRNLYAFKNAKSANKAVYMIANRNPEDSGFKSNFIAYQIVFQGEIELQLELVFGDGSMTDLTEVDYDQELSRKMAEFDAKFEEKFPMNDKNLTEPQIAFARAVLSNTVGGISYFSGQSLVKSSKTPQTQPKPYGPIQLLTAVPSRPFFPRGFLWDEGFHQLLISTWDPQLSKLIITSWFDLMNDEGWIPREIILGDEARARVPNEYLVQHSSVANPPAFFLALESLIDDGQADTEWLGRLRPRLDRWFHWFNTTQTGNFPSTFRWRGRNGTTTAELNPKTMASGLDDFPRATHPTDEEIHLDLRCWMALAARVMGKLGRAVNQPTEAQRFESHYALLSDNQLLERWHWSDRHQMFCDKGLNSEDVKLVTKTAPDGHKYQERKVLRPPTYDCVPNVGYVSLYPLAMQLLDPSNPKLDSILGHIESPDHLWSDYGLRSISKSSFYYNKHNTQSDPPYWRGSVWLNVNYLVLKALKHYSTVSGPAQTRAGALYHRLRANLVDNMFREYRRAGYIWEQYNDRTGQGKGTFPFTGWSALIVRIMAERY